MSLYDYSQTYDNPFMGTAEEQDKKQQDYMANLDAQDSAFKKYLKEGGTFTSSTGGGSGKINNLLSTAGSKYAMGQLQGMLTGGGGSSAAAAAAPVAAEGAAAAGLGGATAGGLAGGAAGSALGAGAAGGAAAGAGAGAAAGAAGAGGGSAVAAILAAI